MTTATATALHVTYVPLESVRPAVRNPKTHNIEAICDSIEGFGFTSPLIVDERTERLVAGHGRWNALIILRAGGANTPDGILTDEDGGWLVPLMRGWSSRNDAEAEAYIVMDNRTNELGSWDNELLSAILEDVNISDASLFEVLRYSEDDMEGLLKYARDESDLGSGSTADITADHDEKKPAETDDDDLGTDNGMTDVPDGPEREKIRCPECGHHFTPGDR